MFCLTSTVFQWIKRNSSLLLPHINKCKMQSLQSHFPVMQSGMSVLEFVKFVKAAQMWHYISHTWLFEPVWLAGQWHLDAPPPQSQGAVQAEHGVTVRLLIKVSIDEFISELWDIDRLTLKGWTAVLIPVLGSDSHREVDCGQQAQHRANDQSCGIAVVYHGLDGGSSFYRRLQRQAALHRKWMQMQFGFHSETKPEMYG